MADEFKPIETQEAFDTAVQSRIDEAVKQYKDWISPEKAAEQTTALQNQIDALTTTNLRMKIAQEKGLPPELADRLTGDTEDDIRKDAELLASLTKARQTPAFNPETPELSGVEKSFYAKNPNLAPNRKENA